MNDTVVVDANIAIKWILNEPDSPIAIALYAMWKKNAVRLLAPTLLAYEVTNTLYRNALAGVITFETVSNGIDLIKATITYHFLSEPTLHIRAGELAMQYNLPATYDAHYLALAEHENCGL